MKDGPADGGLAVGQTPGRGAAPAADLRAVSVSSSPRLPSPLLLAMLQPLSGTGQGDAGTLDAGQGVLGRVQIRLALQVQRRVAGGLPQAAVLAFPRQLDRPHP